LYECARKFRPDVLVGTSAEITHIGKLLRTPSIVLNEDDADVVPLFARAAYPFASWILSPEVCRVGRWEYKRCGYAGYQKLAYLHPNRFTPDPTKTYHLGNGSKRYFLIRCVQLSAHHDDHIRGLTPDLVRQLITRLAPHGAVHISAEGALPTDLQSYALRLQVDEIHHALAQANLLISDSQSMSVEAAVLGVPNIRFTDFVGRISVLEELEQYGLSQGVSPGHPEQLLSAVDRHLSTTSVENRWHERRQHMLSEKIDVTAFLVWLLATYPKSVKELRAQPDLQFAFR
jgi:predicted glycosyltransferase